MQPSLVASTQAIPLIRFSTLRIFILQAVEQSVLLDDDLIKSGCPLVLTKSNQAEYVPEICVLRFLDRLSQRLSKQKFALYLQGSAHLLITQLLDKNYDNCKTLEQAIAVFTLQLNSYSNHSCLQLIMQNNSYLLIAKGARFFEQSAYWSESFTLLLMIQFIRQVTATKWLPKSIHFKNDNLSVLTEYIELSTIQVYFAQKQLSIEIEAELLTTSLPAYKLSTTQAKLQTLPILSFAENVEYALHSYIGFGDCSVEYFCSAIGMHKRQLQRLLKAENRTFKQIKEQLSMAFAITLIKGNKYSISDIAEHLGYLSSSQFARAFKRFTGKTPSSYR